MTFAQFTIALFVILGIGTLIGKAIKRHAPDEDEHRNNGVG